MAFNSSRQMFSNRHVLSNHRNARNVKQIPLTIPKCAQWGWMYLPLATRVQIFAVFFGAVAVSTPFWVYVYTEMLGYMTFGLWHLCIGEDCTSIHDNIIPGRDVPAWFFLVQGTYTIGIVGSCISLGILTHNAEDGQLKMSPVIHRATFCILCITVLQQFVGIYTFLTYFEDTDFLYEKIDWEMDFHGSFYCAIISFILCIVTTLMVYFDDEITKPKKKTTKLPRKYDNYQQYLYQCQQQYPANQYMEQSGKYPINKQPFNDHKSHLS